jgi:hypothetical protein
MQGIVRPTQTVATFRKRAQWQLICASLVASCTTPVGAHDIYTHVTNKWGISCCDGTDCRAVRYRVRTGGVQMLIDDEWFYIPEDLIEYRTLDGDTGETGGGHWCGRHSHGESWTYIKTYCAFLPPRVTSAGPIPVR